MSKLATPTAWGFSVFCDDIRHEIGGKTTLVGIYQSDMVAPFGTAFPFMIPKFGIFVQYFEKPDIWKGDLNLHVYFPREEKDKPAIQIPILRSALVVAAAPNYAIEEDQERVHNLRMPLVLGPIALVQEGFVKVRMHCDDNIIPLGSLRITVAAQNQADVSKS